MTSCLCIFRCHSLSLSLNLQVAICICRSLAAHCRLQFGALCLCFCCRCCHRRCYCCCCGEFTPCDCFAGSLSVQRHILCLSMFARVCVCGVAALKSFAAFCCRCRRCRRRRCRRAFRPRGWSLGLQTAAAAAASNAAVCPKADLQFYMRQL